MRILSSVFTLPQTFLGRFREVCRFRIQVGANTPALQVGQSGEPTSFNFLNQNFELYVDSRNSGASAEIQPGKDTRNLDLVSDAPF